jgi:hypothetical protein
VLATAAIAGFFAAHAVWSVSDGETLVPIYAYEDSDGGRHMHRLVHERLEAAVETGRRRLESNPDRAQCAVFIYDGYIPINGTKTDALLIEIRDYAKGQHVTMAIPYLPGGQRSKFKVYRPKILSFPESADPQDFIERFWAGVDSHEQGSKVWNAHLDQSK